VRHLACVFILGTSCALPLLAKTQQQVSASPPFSVRLEPDLQIERAHILFRLTFSNESGEPLMVDLEAIKLGAGMIALASVEGMGPSFTVLPGRTFFGSNMLRTGGLTPESPLSERDIVILPHSNAIVAVRGVLADAPLELSFEEAVSTMDGSVLTVAPIPLLQAGTPLTDVRPSTVRVGARLLGGAIIGPTPSLPLRPLGAEVITWTGILEGFVGMWTRWVEAQLVLRPGFGRVVGAEIGVRPGIEALTLLVGYGFDAFQVISGPGTAGTPLLGHGPRWSVDFAFDTPQEVLSNRRPKRFGVFVTSGWSWLASSPERTQLIPIIEGGFRLRLL
jgi:hypothetical protein